MNAILVFALAAAAQGAPSRDEILKQDIQNAIRSLGSERYTESFVAAEELRAIGRRAVPALAEALGKADAKPQVKRALCDLLGVLRDPHPDALKALTARLQDGDEYGVSIASAAARALGLIADDASIAPLAATLKSKPAQADRVLKYECIQALGALRAVGAADAVKAALDDKKPAGAGGGEDAPLVATAAADALGLMRAVDAEAELGALLSDVTTDGASGQTLAVHAARALRRIHAAALEGKTAKDDARAGVLAGDPEDVRKTVEAWQKWWTEKSAEANIAETKARIAKIAEAIEAYKKGQGEYPPILEYLKTKPQTAKDWPEGGYYAGELKDAWGMNFVYRPEGTGAPFDLVSMGADRRTAGAGSGADLWNHDRWRAAKKAASLKAIEEAAKVVEKFNADNGRYPEKLIHLVARPSYTLKVWPEGGYLKTMPKDAYDNFLIYAAPGKDGRPFDLWSPGADGIEGGADENEDLRYGAAK